MAPVFNGDNSTCDECGFNYRQNGAYALDNVIGPRIV
jgi:hypothetical protein